MTLWSWLLGCFRYRERKLSETARGLAFAGADPAVAIATLVTLGHGGRRLSRSARGMQDESGVRVPLTPLDLLAQAFLYAAAEGRSEIRFRAEDYEAAALERAVKQLPLEEGFALIAEMVPGLSVLANDIRSRPQLLTAADVPQDMRNKIARSGVDPDEWIGRHSDQLLPGVSAVPILDRVSRVVGPESGQTDRLLASTTAWEIVGRYLIQLSGLQDQDPR